MKWVLLMAAALLVGMGVYGYLKSHDKSSNPSPKDPFQVDPAKPRVTSTVAPLPPLEQPSSTDDPRPPAKTTLENFTWDSGDPLTNGCFDIVRRVLNSEFRDNGQARLAEVIEKLLETNQMGDDLRRQDVAAAVSNEILDETDAFMGKTTVLANGLSPLQEQAIRALSQKIAADFRKRIAPGAGSQIHDGILQSAVDFEVPAGYTKISWKMIGGFEYIEGQPLPKEVADLHGKKVGIAGYMMAMGDYADVHKFLLVESQWTCCFGIPPEAHQVVVARIPKERPGVELTSIPVLLLGTLDAGEERDGRWVTSVYRMVCDDVIEIE